MVDVQKERDFIKNVDNVIRDLEIKKAKLEQSRESLELELKDVEELMTKLGCTPETIEEKLNELESNVIKLKEAINAEIDKVKHLV